MTTELPLWTHSSEQNKQLHWYMSKLMLKLILFGMTLSVVNSLTANPPVIGANSYINIAMKQHCMRGNWYAVRSSCCGLNIKATKTPFTAIFLYDWYHWKRHVSLCSSISKPYIWFWYAKTKRIMSFTMILIIKENCYEGGAGGLKRYATQLKPYLIWVMRGDVIYRAPTASMFC